MQRAEIHATHGGQLDTRPPRGPTCGAQPWKHTEGWCGRWGADREDGWTRRWCVSNRRPPLSIVLLVGGRLRLRVCARARHACSGGPVRQPRGVPTLAVGPTRVRRRRRPTLSTVSFETLLRVPPRHPYSKKSSPRPKNSPARKLGRRRRRRRADKDAPWGGG